MSLEAVELVYAYGCCMLVAGEGLERVRYEVEGILLSSHVLS